MRRSLLPAIVATLALAACSGSPKPELEPDVKPVRAAGVDQPLQYGQCAEANRRALENPEMVVDRLASPKTMKPALFQKAPGSVFRKDGSMALKVDVVVDTLGKADMSTFKVVEASHPWFVQNAKAVIPRWTFDPAQVVGCKVRRVYKLMVSVPPRTAPRRSRG